MGSFKADQISDKNYLANIGAAGIELAIQIVEVEAVELTKSTSLILVAACEALVLCADPDLLIIVNQAGFVRLGLLHNEVDLAVAVGQKVKELLSCQIELDLICLVIYFHCTFPPLNYNLL